MPIAGLHHAKRDAAAGFCVFNDCGILIEHLKHVHGLSRIAYVDIDAHAYAAAALCRIAEEFCEGRLVGLGGGGYNLRNLAQAWCSVLENILPKDQTSG